MFQRYHQQKIKVLIPAKCHGRQLSPPTTRSGHISIGLNCVCAKADVYPSTVCAVITPHTSNIMCPNLKNYLKRK